MDLNQMCNTVRRIRRWCALVANGFGYSLYNARPLAEQSLDGQRIETVPLSGNHRPMRLGLASLAGGRQPRLVNEFRNHSVARVSDDHIPGMRPRLRERRE